MSSWAVLWQLEIFVRQPRHREQIRLDLERCEARAPQFLSNSLPVNGSLSWSGYIPICLKYFEITAYGASSQALTIHLIAIRRTTDLKILLAIFLVSVSLTCRSSFRLYFLPRLIIPASRDCVHEVVFFNKNSI